MPGFDNNFTNPNLMDNNYTTMQINQLVRQKNSIDNMLNALLGNNNNGGLFGGTGGTIGIFALIIIFILLFGNGGLGGGNASLQTNDLLYLQTQDANIRGLAQGQCNITDTVLTSNYNNLVSMKDIQQQMSNSIAAIGNLVTQQNQETRNLILQNKIDSLSDQITVLRGQNSNLIQTANLSEAIQNSTNTILNSQGRYVMNPPCYQNCGCGNSLY